MKKIVVHRVLVIALVSILILIGSGTFYVQTYTYHPTENALEVSQTGQIDAKTKTLIFEGDGDEEKPAVIFYQGAFVENTSYSVWAKKLATAGFSVYLLHTPLNLAVLHQNAAQEIIEENQLTKVVIGGHSLGGVMGSRFVHEKVLPQVQGVFFLASYPDEKGSLLDFEGAVLSITASKDNVLDQQAYEAAKKFLPLQTIYETISGGNHAGFGSYGAQKGDHSATISDAQQQELVSELLINWLQQ